MRDILCLSNTPWQIRPTRTQQLLTRLTDAHILFFEPPASHGEPAQEQGRRMRSHITVYTLPAPIPQEKPRSFFQRRALNRDLTFIRNVMREHRVQSPLLWCTAPEQVLIMEQFPCRGVAYDCFREWEEPFLDFESDLVNRADVTFAASDGLITRLSPCSDNIALIPNGVNSLMFDRGEFSPPDQIAALYGQPVLGHVGDLTSQVDLEPLINAAQINPEWKFLLIGRYTAKIGQKLSRYRNIILTGPVNAVELPDYLSVCSVLFDLKRNDRLGCDILPAHLYEYLATGKPIVLMVEPGSAEPFPNVIQTAYDTNGFLRRCRKALAEHDSALSGLRRAYAAQASWANRAAEVARILEHTGLF